MSDQLKIQIGQRIKAARNLRSLTQEKLAELADCHIDSLSLIERGRTFPSLETLFKLCSALELELSSVVNENVGSKANSRIKLEAQMWTLIEGMSDTELKKLAEIANVLSKD